MFEGIFLARTEDEQHPPPSPSACTSKGNDRDSSATTNTTTIDDDDNDDEGARWCQAGRKTHRQLDGQTMAKLEKNSKKEEGMKKTLEEGNRIWIRILAFERTQLKMERPRQELMGWGASRAC